MTIPSTTRKAGPLLGTGAQTAWPFTFKVFAESDILVTTANSLGIETVRVLDTDYSVVLNSNQDTSPGGTVTYPISGSALATGDVLTITGNLAYDQPLDLPAGGNFSPLALENELDRMAMQIQQLKEQLGRATQVSVSTSADVTLPSPLSNAVIGWDSTAEALQNFPLSELATAVAFATYRYDTFTGDGTTTVFTLDADPVTLGNIDVSVDGLTSVPGVDHTILNTALIFAVAPSLGAEILARYGQGLGSGMSGDALDIAYQPLGGTATSVQEKLRENVSVWDFDADSTGVTDASTAINTAIAYAQANGKGVFIPDGTYKLTSPIVITGNSVNVTGNGIATVLKPYGAINAIQIGTGSGGTTQNSGYLGNFLIQAGDTTVLRGIYAWNLREWNIEKIQCFGVDDTHRSFAQAAFELLYSWRVNVSSCLAYYVTGDSFRLGGATVVGTESNALAITGCKVNRCTGIGFRSYGAGHAFMGSSAEACDNGGFVSVYCAGYTISGGYAETCGASTGYSVHIGNNQNGGSISGFYISSTQVNHHAIDLTSINGFVITGCNFSHLVGSAFGIYTNASVTGVIALGNNVEGGVGTLGGGATWPGSTISTLPTSYAEGTWAPTSPDISYTSASGTYTKVGKLVTLTFKVQFPATANAANARLLGMPYTPTSDSSAICTGNADAAVSAVTSAAYLSFTKIDGTAYKTNANLTTNLITGSISFQA
jgi:hypothetical protein